MPVLIKEEEEKSSRERIERGKEGVSFFFFLFLSFFLSFFLSSKAQAREAEEKATRNLL